MRSCLISIMTYLMLTNMVSVDTMLNIVLILIMILLWIIWMNQGII